MFQSRLKENTACERPQGAASAAPRTAPQPRGSAQIGQLSGAFSQDARSDPRTTSDAALESSRLRGGRPGLTSTCDENTVQVLANSAALYVPQGSRATFQLSGLVKLFHCNGKSCGGGLFTVRSPCSVRKGSSCALS